MLEAQGLSGRVWPNVFVPYLRLIRSGRGGPQGDGRQMYSWVHIEDVANAIEWFYEHPALEGTYNAGCYLRNCGHLDSDSNIQGWKMPSTIFSILKPSFHETQTKDMVVIGGRPCRICPVDVAII